LRVLLVGAGGRDSALAWKLAQSPLLRDLHVAPGNAGMAALATCHPNVAFDDFEAVVALARELEVDLAIVGAEDLLVAGLASLLQEAGVPCLGPTRGAARLEGSKIFSKSLMDELGIPTAPWRSYDTREAALADIADWRGPVAVKADGLAAGCGAFVCHTPETAHEAVDALLVEQIFGDSGLRVLIEDLIEGREVSVMAATDGTHVLPLPAARDYKRLGDGDTGPNTGGMGAHCPSTDSTAEEIATLARLAIQPVVDELRRRGTPFRGVVYAGVMLTADGPRVLEYNCRFGNPETQALVRVLDADLLALLYDTAVGSLAEWTAPRADGFSVAVCVAAEHYPELQLEPAPVPVRGLHAAAKVEGVQLFHGMTQGPTGADALLAAGGRVITVSAHGASFEQAIERAYAAVDHIEVPRVRARRDIGRPAVTGHTIPC